MSLPQTAFITGGSSGIGLALATHLLTQNYKIFIADRDISGARSLASRSPNGTIYYTTMDVSSWPSQISAFQAAIKLLGRINFVAPIAGIGERKWLPSTKDLQNLSKEEFKEPDLSVIDVDLKGVLYTLVLAVQHFRRQDPDASGVRGKIATVASVCGFYCVPTLPIYTAAKHGVVGLVRAYGKLLAEEEIITLNAVCPNIVRTSISTDDFYESVEREGLLVGMDGVIGAFEEILKGEGSGEVYECPPKGGWVKRAATEYLDKDSEKSCMLLVERARPLHH